MEGWHGRQGDGEKKAERRQTDYEQSLFHQDSHCGRQRPTGISITMGRLLTISCEGRHQHTHTSVLLRAHVDAQIWKMRRCVHSIRDLPTFKGAASAAEEKQALKACTHTHTHAHTNIPINTCTDAILMQKWSSV